MPQWLEGFRYDKTHPTLKCWSIDTLTLGAQSLRILYIHLSSVTSFEMTSTSQLQSLTSVLTKLTYPLEWMTEFIVGISERRSLVCRKYRFPYFPITFFFVIYYSILSFSLEWNISQSNLRFRALIKFYISRKSSGSWLVILGF